MELRLELECPQCQTPIATTLEALKADRAATEGRRGTSVACPTCGTEVSLDPGATP